MTGKPHQHHTGTDHANHADHADMSGVNFMALSAALHDHARQ